jgi:hypothetical protein
MADARVRFVGQVEDMDGMPVKVGVDYDAVTIQAWGAPIRFQSAAAEEFAQLYVSACWQAARQAGEMAAEAVSDDDGPVFITVNDAPPHPPRTLADYEQAGGVVPDG